VPEQELKAQPADLQKAMDPERIVFDRSTMAAMIGRPVKVAKGLGLPLYCGEWGAIDRAPMELRVRWYRDMRSVLEENQIGWATWDFQGGFGLRKGGQPVTPVIQALGLTI
jgi:endoglucanase